MNGFGRDPGNEIDMTDGNYTLHVSRINYEVGEQHTVRYGRAWLNFSALYNVLLNIQFIDGVYKSW